MVFVKIKNMRELLSHGSVKGRKIALDVIEYALGAIDAYGSVGRLVQLTDDTLKVGSLTYDLSKMGDIYVIGAGKGVISIAKALEDILGDRLKGGLIIEKRGQGRKLGRIKVMEASHPVPDEAGVRGGREVVRIAKSAEGGDLVFACITGGCSALMSLPVEGISLEDLKKVTDLLLRCGALIEEINAVRKHLSAIKGGRLAKLIHPAETISLIVVDEVAGLPWGPTVPDNMNSTFEDAASVLRKYDLWEKVPDSVRKHLERADPSMGTLKAKDFEKLKTHNFILANAETVCEAADKRAKELGLNSMILSTVMEGEAREVGIVLATIAREAEKNGRPLKPPCVLVSGGEMTVTIEGEPGEGGPNQEFILGAALKIGGSKNIVIASVDTDGTDGPTDMAGGITDGYTLRRAEKEGIDIFENLRRHNSSYALRKLGDAILTGPTGTNVMNLRVIVVTA